VPQKWRGKRLASKVRVSASPRSREKLRGESSRSSHRPSVVALMTVEGELDDISGIGQTQAAHELCKNIPPEKQLDYIQKGVGHYGVFNGSRWRTEISPRIKDFIRTFPVAS
jgi:poly(3-hydroxybutyrate) depolymerase